MFLRVCSKSTSRFLWQAKNSAFLNRNTNFFASIMATSTYAKSFEPLPSHAKHWKNERIYSILTLPLAPAAYFIHGTTMDYVLTAVVVLHMHYGAMSVGTDYIRPIVVGEKLSALVPKLVYLVTALMLAGLLHFNYYDVGLTRAFEMVFSL